MLEYHAKAYNLPIPLQEYRFCKRRWRIDYFFKELNLAIEIEGGVWIRGRHTRGAGAIKDMEKYNEMAIMGIYLMRFTPQQIQTGYAIEEIKRFYESYQKRML